MTQEELREQIEKLAGVLMGDKPGDNNIGKALALAEKAIDAGYRLPDSLISDGEIKEIYDLVIDFTQLKDFIDWRKLPYIKSFLEPLFDRANSIISKLGTKQHQDQLTHKQEGK